MSTQQLSLELEATDETRTPPNTMLWCPTTEQYVLRSRREDWPHELIEQSDRDVTEEVPELTDDCNIATQTYEVEFIYEYREIVRVEACGKGDAVEEAKHVRTLKGEFVDTLHSSTRSIGEESIATVEYLENHGLLPEDHDVTPADLERWEEKLTGDAA